jgi:hypothetical protein
VFPREDVTVRAEEIDERAFLFGGEVSADAQHLAIIDARVNGDLLGALRGLKGSGLPLGVRRIFGHRLPDDRELLRGNGRSDELATLQVTLISALEKS